MLPATKGNLDRRVLSLTKETIPIVSNRRFLEDAAKSIIGQVKVDPVLGFRDSFLEHLDFPERPQPISTTFVFTDFRVSEVRKTSAGGGHSL